MRVFVTGATGVLGRRVVELFGRAGHDVTALVRSPAAAQAMRSLGATPVQADLFDTTALGAAMTGHDAVASLATAIPKGGRALRRAGWAANDRIRTHGARSVVDAALGAGVAVLVQESTVLNYAAPDSAAANDAALNYPSSGNWVDEATPLDPVPQGRSALAGEAEAARFTAAGRRGVALRFGLFYGPDGHVTETLLTLLRARVAPGFGAAGFVPAVHIDDAAAAVVAATLAGPAGVYNVCDDRPLSRQAHFAAAAAVLGLRAPRVPPLRAAPLAGFLGPSLTRSLLVSNRRFRAATGWSPRYPDAAAGWPVALAGAAPPAPAARRARILLAILALACAVVGLWAGVAPRSFYDDFPGFGRVWVAVDGAYNEHLARDVGGLNLALTVVLVAAALRLTPTLVRTAAVAALVYGAPHFTYHLLHLDVFGWGDATASVVALGFGVAAPLALLSAARALEHHPGP